MSIVHTSVAELFGNVRLLGYIDLSAASLRFSIMESGGQRQPNSGTVASDFPFRNATDDANGRT